MSTFNPPTELTIAFVILSIAVAAADVMLVRLAAPPERRARWTTMAAVAAVVWLGLHAAVANSGILEGSGFPPPVMPFLALTMGVGVGVALSPVGRRLAQLPLAWLVGLQAFRLPLEWLLHGLFEAGALPVQMTWSGYNFDVLTAIGAVAVAGALLAKRDVPIAVVWVWNVLGSFLLLTVVVIAVLSTPLPFRQFLNEPPVMLAFHTPYTWIVSLMVWTALVGHIVIFRALWGQRGRA